jgi:hypothetical protein
MGEVVRFIAKSERERARLIREARAIYDSIFPSSDPVGEKDKGAASGAASLGTNVANAHRSDGGLRS